MQNINTYFQRNIFDYVQELYQYPIKLVPLILDIAIVVFLLYKFIVIRYVENIKLYLHF